MSTDGLRVVLDRRFESGTVLRILNRGSGYTTDGLLNSFLFLCARITNIVLGSLQAHRNLTSSQFRPERVPTLDSETSTW